MGNGKRVHPVMVGHIPIPLLHVQNKSCQRLAFDHEIINETQILEHLDNVAGRLREYDLARCEREVGKLRMQMRALAQRQIGHVLVAHVHVVHHQFVAQLAPGLRVLHFLVHQTVHDGDAAVDAEGVRHLFVEVVEVSVDFVA